MLVLYPPMYSVIIICSEFLLLCCCLSMAMMMNIRGSAKKVAKILHLPEVGTFRSVAISRRNNNNIIRPLPLFTSVVCVHNHLCHLLSAPSTRDLPLTNHPPNVHFPSTPPTDKINRNCLLSYFLPLNVYLCISTFPCFA